jgi:membrane protein implicated in regulation of membrane protease activity
MDWEDYLVCRPFPKVLLLVFMVLFVKVVVLVVLMVLVVFLASMLVVWIMLLVLVVFVILVIKKWTEMHAKEEDQSVRRAAKEEECMAKKADNET